MMNRKDPIVVLGMHRSGTTLLAEILAELGVFMGHKLEAHFESLFFKKLNVLILERAHANWDVPLGLNYVMTEPETKKNIEIVIREKINSSRFVFEYTGIRRHNLFLKDDNYLWGWKEPRTTITFPLYDKIFPDARYIFLFRNGVDVAKSLVAREMTRKGNLKNDIYSVRCTSYEGAFNLWEEYNSFFFKHYDESIPMLSISYERLLSDPHTEINNIFKFIGLTTGKENIENICRKINHSRKYSFIDDPQLLDFYEKVRTTPLMKKLGYDKIIED